MAAPGMQDATSLVLLNGQTYTATGNTASFTLPQGEAYAMYLVTTAVSGTTPTLSGTLQTSLDNGVTWVNTGNVIVASATAGGSAGIVFKPTLSISAAGAVITANPGTASALNQPINRKFCRLAFTAGGTTPSFTVTLYALTNPKGYSVV